MARLVQLGIRQARYFVGSRRHSSCIWRPRWPISPWWRAKSGCRAVSAAAQQATASSAMTSAMMSALWSPMRRPQRRPARTTMVPDFARLGFTAATPLPNQGFSARFLGGCFQWRRERKERTRSSRRRGPHRRSRVPADRSRRPRRHGIGETPTSRPAWGRRHRGQRRSHARLPATPRTSYSRPLAPPPAGRGRPLPAHYHRLKSEPRQRGLRLRKNHGRPRRDARHQRSNGHGHHGRSDLPDGQPTTAPARPQRVLIRRAGRQVRVETRPGSAWRVKGGGKWATWPRRPFAYASRGRNEPYRLGYFPWRPTQSVHRFAAVSMSCCWLGFAPPPSMMTDGFDDLA